MTTEAFKLYVPRKGWFIATGVEFETDGQTYYEFEPLNPDPAAPAYLPRTLTISLDEVFLLTR